MRITSSIELRRHFAHPRERAVRKQLAFLDRHCLHFIALSPFVVLSTTDADHHLDASPRGGEPGFVKVAAAGTLLIPDAPGNNRLDSLENIVCTGKIGLLFMIPGIDETLRVNGHASLSMAPELLALAATERRVPKIVIEVGVTAAYLHCAKAFMRSRLWADGSRVERSRLPSMGQMISEQTGLHVPPETQAEMRSRYAGDL